MHTLQGNSYRKLIKPEINDYVAPFFEKLCMEQLPELVEADYRKIGRWWFKEHEIDILGIAQGKTVYGECKFRNQKTGLKTLHRLQETKENIRLDPENEEYVLFSKSGFTERLNSLDRDDLYLFSPRDLETF